MQEYTQYAYKYVSMWTCIYVFVYVVVNGTSTWIYTALWGPFSQCLHMTYQMFKFIFLQISPVKPRQKAFGSSNEVHHWS